MKNFKLASKLFLLTAILISSILLVAYVAVDRLSAVKAHVQHLVRSTIVKSNRTSEMHVKFLAGVRAQKNTVLSPDDETSANYAAISRTAFTESREAISKLNELVLEDRVDGQSTAVEELLKAFEKAEEVNNQVLDLAIQNTNVKARQILSGAIQSDVENLNKRLQLWVDESMTKGATDADLVKRLVTLYAMHDSVVSIPFAAAKHIEPLTVEELTALEKKVEEFQEKIQSGLVLASGGDLSSQSDVRNRISDMKVSLAKLFQLSRLDTNNRSTELSLKGSKQAFDEVVKRISKLEELLARESDSGSKLSAAAYANALWWILGTTGLGILLGGIVAYLVKESVTKPVFEVRNLAQAMAGGDLRSRIQLNQQDEVGELSDATNSLADSLSRIVAQIQKVSEGLASSAEDLGGVSNHLLSQSEATSLNATSVASAAEQLSSNINTMAAAAEEMSVNVASISSASEEMSMNVGTISSAAEQTSSNVSAVSTAVGEISSSFTDVLNDVREGSRVAGEASRMADSATATIQTLSQSGTEISKVTEAIKMIALQTNLLALNATIEATSAGEAGKGFAVVAHEIKELANQSAKAAEDIARKIEGVQNDTRQAVQVIQNVSQIIKDINASSGRISLSVEKQTRAATMISQNVGEANKGVGDIARSIAEVAKAAGDMSRNVAEAARGATDVSRNVGEAAKAAGGISSDIHGVSDASRSTNQSASKVHDSADNLDRIGKELKKLVGRFKINSEDIATE